MSNKILFGGAAEQSGDPGHSLNSSGNKEQVRPNLFPGRTEADTQHAKFPDWDITPPNQFINPRIKKK